MSLWYLDSSAIVKFAVVERESKALGEWRNDLNPGDVLVTCELAVIEVTRAVARVQGDIDVALDHLDALEQLIIDRNLLRAAGQLHPLTMRSLDAIHLAAALALGDDLAGVVTYDERMHDAAHDLGLTTMAPGREPDR